MNTEELVIKRVVDAPKALVWDAFTKSEHLAHWWGPADFELDVKKFDFRVGGIFLYNMKASNGFTMWGKFVYKEITATNKLVFIVSFSDENGGTTRQPADASWPLEMLNTLTFEEQHGKTVLTLKAIAYNASAEEIRTFVNGFASMNEGFGGTFDKLDSYIKTIHH